LLGRPNGDGKAEDAARDAPMTDLGWAILLVGLALTVIAAQAERREKLRARR
jgi:hypothetical protein